MTGGRIRNGAAAVDATAVRPLGVAVTAKDAASVPRTSLVGRSELIEKLCGAVDQRRLVTLTGPGGSGKTRLGSAVTGAARQSGHWLVTWVSLAGLVDPDLLPDAVAAAVGVRDVTGEGSLEVVAARLAGESLVLLALDNCEHLVNACADLVDALLDRCPRLHVLATSREPLGVSGEVIWSVPPLAVPERNATDPVEVGETAAVRLFTERAQAVAPGFALDADTTPAVVRICRRLDGLPLAIELAAARVRVLAVDQIAAGLDDACRLLVGGPRGLPARHQTLRAALDWSHDLLDVRERNLLHRLGVFRGGFDLAAAEDVGASGPVDRREVLDLLTRLVDKSLVQVATWHGRARYRMLATVRQYAREWLAETGQRDSALQAHLQHYLRLVESLQPRLAGPDEPAVLDRFELEADNLRLALTTARETGAAETGLRLTGGLWRLCYLRGHYREGREWLDWAIAAGADAAPALRAVALRGSGMLAMLQCDYPAAAERLATALALFRQIDDRVGVAATLQTLGSVAREQGRYADAEALHRESLELFTAAGNAAGAARAHGYLGFAAWLQGHLTQAEQECATALASFRMLGDAEGTAWSTLSLGVSALHADEYERAGRLLEDALRIARDSGFREGVAWSTHELGVLRLKSGDPAGAEVLLRQAIDGHRDLGDQWRTASAVADLAAAVLATGRTAAAARLLGAAARIRDAIGTIDPPVESTLHERTADAARDALGTDSFHRLVDEGRLADLDAVLEAPAEERPIAPAPRDTEAPQTPPTAPAPAEPQPSARPPRQRRARRAAAPAASADAAPSGAGTGTAPLRLRALGGTSVSVGDRLLAPADFGYAKPRELLFLLASFPPRTKEQIASALWPDLSDAALRNALHTALRELRRALGDPAWISYAGGTYGLAADRDQQYDVAAFRAALSRASRAGGAEAALPHLQRAVELYRGDFLSDQRVGDWAEEQREALHRAFHQALLGIGRALSSLGQHERAAEAYGRAVSDDAYDEAAHRELMAAWSRAGQPARAVRHYQDLRQRLADELGVEPAAATSAVYRNLVQPVQQRRPR